MHLFEVERCRTNMCYLYSLFESFREKIITVLYSDVILPRRIHPSSRNLKRNRKTFSVTDVVLVT